MTPPLVDPNDFGPVAPEVELCGKPIAPVLRLQEAGSSCALPAGHDGRCSPF